ELLFLLGQVTDWSLGKKSCTICSCRSSNKRPDSVRVNVTPPSSPRRKEPPKPPPSPRCSIGRCATVNVRCPPTAQTLCWHPHSGHRTRDPSRSTAAFALNSSKSLFTVSSCVL